MENVPASDHRKLTSTIVSGGSLHQTRKDWDDAQKRIQDDNFERKRLSNQNVDNLRHRDLSFLQSYGGPFCSVIQVHQFLSDERILVKNKLLRLYCEVRYAKLCALSIPKTSEIFRLKRDHKNLSVQEYANNLCVYLSNVTSNVKVSMSDLSDALSDLVQA